MFFLFDLVGPDVVAGAEDRNQLRGLVAAQEIVEETALDHYLVEIVGERFLRVIELLAEDPGRLGGNSPRSISNASSGWSRSILKRRCPITPDLKAVVAT